MGTLWKGHPAWHSPIMARFFIASLFSCGVIGIALYFAVDQDLIPGGYAVLGFLCLLGFAFGSPLLYRNKTLYLITGRGVRFEAGFPVKTDKREFSYHKIQAVDVHQTLTEKLFFRTGTVTISSAASDLNNDDIVFAGVSDPDRIARLIRDGEDRAHGHHNQDDYAYASRFQDQQPASQSPFPGSYGETSGYPAAPPRPPMPPGRSPSDYGLPPR